MADVQHAMRAHFYRAQETGLTWMGTSCDRGLKPLLRALRLGRCAVFTCRAVSGYAIYVLMCDILCLFQASAVCNQKAQVSQQSGVVLGPACHAARAAPPADMNIGRIHVAAGFALMKLRAIEWVYNSHQTIQTLPQPFAIFASGSAVLTIGRQPKSASMQHTQTQSLVRYDNPVLVNSSKDKSAAPKGAKKVWSPLQAVGGGLSEHGCSQQQPATMRCMPLISWIYCSQGNASAEQKASTATEDILNSILPPRCACTRP